ncbi:MAG: Thiol:disulfide interchange protein DsbD [Owenweeksia sp. TMED14]|nr:MAG: Thiol:disulfide interchange protein DsbD [Owenweeksia sp. TMED14]
MTIPLQEITGPDGNLFIQGNGIAKEYSNAQNSASSILENALIKAKAENKNVFLKYSASWCGWCKKLDKQMKNDSCKSFFDSNYMIVTLAVNESEKNRHLENPGATDFLRKHKGEDKGLPFWVILDNTGVLIEKGRGYPGGWRLGRFITSLKKTSNLTEENLNIIEDIFLLK